MRKFILKETNFEQDKVFTHYWSNDGQNFPDIEDIEQYLAEYYPNYQWEEVPDMRLERVSLDHFKVECPSQELYDNKTIFIKLVDENSTDNNGLIREIPQYFYCETIEAVSDENYNTTSYQLDCVLDCWATFACKMNYWLKHKTNGVYDCKEQFLFMRKMCDRFIWTDDGFYIDYLLQPYLMKTGGYTYKLIRDPNEKSLDIEDWLWINSGKLDEIDPITKEPLWTKEKWLNEIWNPWTVNYNSSRLEINTNVSQVDDSYILSPLEENIGYLQNKSLMTTNFDNEDFNSNGKYRYFALKIGNFTLPTGSFEDQEKPVEKSNGAFKVESFQNIKLNEDLSESSLNRTYISGESLCYIPFPKDIKEQEYLYALNSVDHGIILGNGSILGMLVNDIPPSILALAIRSFNDGLENNLAQTIGDKLSFRDIALKTLQFQYGIEPTEEELTAQFTDPTVHNIVFTKEIELEGEETINDLLGNKLNINIFDLVDDSIKYRVLFDFEREGEQREEEEFLSFFETNTTNINIDNFELNKDYLIIKKVGMLITSQEWYLRFTSSDEKHITVQLFVDPTFINIEEEETIVKWNGEPYTLISPTEEISRKIELSWFIFNNINCPCDITNIYFKDVIDFSNTNFKDYHFENGINVVGGDHGWYITINPGPIFTPNRAELKDTIDSNNLYAYTICSSPQGIFETWQWNNVLDPETNKEWRFNDLWNEQSIDVRERCYLRFESPDGLYINNLKRRKNWKILTKEEDIQRVKNIPPEGEYDYTKWFLWEGHEKDPEGRTILYNATGDVIIPTIWHDFSYVPVNILVSPVFTNYRKENPLIGGTNFFEQYYEILSNQELSIYNVPEADPFLYSPGFWQWIYYIDGLHKIILTADMIDFAKFIGIKKEGEQWIKEVPNWKIKLNVNMTSNTGYKLDIDDIKNELYPWTKASIELLSNDIITFPSTSEAYNNWLQTNMATMDTSKNAKDIDINWARVNLPYQIAGSVLGGIGAGAGSGAGISGWGGIIGGLIGAGIGGIEAGIMGKSLENRIAQANEQWANEWNGRLANMYSAPTSLNPSGFTTGSLIYSPSNDAKDNYELFRTFTITDIARHEVWNDISMNGYFYLSECYYGDYENRRNYNFIKCSFDEKAHYVTKYLRQKLIPETMIFSQQKFIDWFSMKCKSGIRLFRTNFTLDNVDSLIKDNIEINYKAPITWKRFNQE